MNLPECYEAWRQADAREAELERKTELFPCCARCGNPIQDAQLVYIQNHDEFYCLDCIEAMTEFNEAAEVEE